MVVSGKKYDFAKMHVRVSRSVSIGLYFRSAKYPREKPMQVSDCHR
jgi:hypothetical protein